MLNTIFGLGFFALSVLQFLVFVTYYEDPMSWVLFVTMILTLGVGVKNFLET